MQLKAKKYKVRKENGNILAEKGRFSRWGPYVNHIGLIIFLIGTMLRFFPEMYLDEHIWVREGEQVVIKGTDGEYFLRNEEFIVELYDDEDELYSESLARSEFPVVSKFQTTATLLQRQPGTIGADAELEEVKQHKIRVNDPLTFEGFSLYQVDYKLNELSSFTFTLASIVEEDRNEELMNDIQFEFNLYDPDMVYEFENGYRVEVLEYFPNFMINDNNEPITQNRIPDNPRIVFEVFTPDMDPETDDGEISMVGIQVNEPLFGENDYRVRMIDVDMRNVTALTVRKDRTLPIISLGGLIFMIGLVQGSYWHHRRIWLQNRNGQIWIAGHANKNWHALKRDFQDLNEKTSIPMPIDQLDEEPQQTEGSEGVENENDSTKQ